MYTMMEACRETGLTYQALKFYCNEGLIPNVHRDKNNRRYFDDATVKWIKDLNCLKKCGMSIEEMKEYLELCLQGPKSIAVRQQILARKQEALQQQLDKIKESMDYIEWKQNFYNDVLSGRRPYISNLIKVESAEE